MCRRHAAPLVRQKLGQLIGKIVRRRLTPIALERERRHRIAAGRPADREVDAIAVQRAQHAEVLRHLQRAVVGQHDAAAADADTRGRRGDGRNQDFRARAGQHRRAVVLGHPIPAIARLLGELRQVDGVSEGVCACRSF